MEHAQVNEGKISRRSGRIYDEEQKILHCDEVSLQVTSTVQENAQTFDETDDYRPINFGAVAPGIFRSSLPLAENFEFLRSLGLKTILSLVHKDFTPEFHQFVQTNDINHKVIDMIGTKKLKISELMMKSILHIVMNKANHPILIHCNHGRHRTGCAVAAFRHTTGWGLSKILQEYSEFATPKIRDCDVQYISNFDVSTLGEILSKAQKVQSRLSIVTQKMWRMLFLSILLTMILLTLRFRQTIDVYKR
ncbi:unnamed protein product [Blumeria hordei]|uniref:diphosphoinositol-polyphosphate diphosphatase n=1 Tax=Blumeria hordei TaxID=2867405 RepID=A0A383V0V6_BLUHO|nr:unnamed protein product [Blumeria hordei]